MILQLVCSFIERTFLAAPTYTHLAIELGYLFILQDQVKEASVWYSEAMKVDENSVAALTGLCRLGRVGAGRAGVGSQAGWPSRAQKRDVGEHCPQRVCEFGGALYDRALFHESTGIDILTQERHRNTQKGIQSSTGDQRRNREAEEEAETNPFFCPKQVASHHHRDMQDNRMWLPGTWAKPPQMFLHQADSFPVSSFKRRAPAGGQKGSPRDSPPGSSPGQPHSHASWRHHRIWPG